MKGLKIKEIENIGVLKGVTDKREQKIGQGEKDINEMEKRS